MLYRAKENGDLGVKSCRIIGRDIPLGFELTGEFFVDNSGLGGDDEPALTFTSFLNKVKTGRYYGIKEAGQFQVYIREFKKIAKSRAEIYSKAGILNSKLISKSCRVINYINGNKTIRLYSTDILKIEGEKIILNSGGYKTHTTKSRINEFLPGDIRVYQKDFKWFIDNRGQRKEFFDGIEL